VALARYISGPVLFTDAADATSSGANGDSNALIKALQAGGYGKRVLAQIIDAPAAEAAHNAGVGATISIGLGGSVDKSRFQPLAITATVESLSRGRARLETMGLPLEAGPTAVLSFDNFTVVVLRRPVFLFDRGALLRQRPRPAGFRPHRGQVPAHRVPYVRPVGGEEFQR
jgi:microcystin degradation protein MlrC